MNSQELKQKASDMVGQNDHVAALLEIAAHVAALAEKALGIEPPPLPAPPPKPKPDPWANALRYVEGWGPEPDAAALATSLEASYTDVAVKTFTRWDADDPTQAAELAEKFGFDPTGRRPDSPHTFIYATFDGAPIKTAFHGMPPANIVQR